MGEKRFIFYENIGSGILGKILLLFKKFNRAFFSIYNCKKFRIVLQKNQNVAPFIYHNFNHCVA